jgi:hypothetical protein
MLNELGQEYIVAARAKGLSEAPHHLAPCAAQRMVPLVTVIALSYAGLLEGSVLTETVFAWPGLGLYITNSLQNADMNAVLGGTLVVGIDLHRPQPVVRPAVPPARPADAADDEQPHPRPLPHDWLMSDRPQSRRQAKLGRAYLAWRGFARNRWRWSAWPSCWRWSGGRLRADWIAPYSPYRKAICAARLLPPSAEHWFGTDDQGRDILSRIIYGSRITLFVVGLVAVLAAPVGLLVGTVAGYAAAGSTRC